MTPFLLCNFYDFKFKLSCVWFSPGNTSAFHG
jgi:hypothetical protein